MSYSLRQIALESKFCYDLHLDVFDQIIPASLISKVLTTCDAWEKRERDLNMVSYKGSRKGVYSYVASLPSALPSRKFRSPSSTEPNASLTPLNPLLALSVSQATRLFFRK